MNPQHQDESRETQRETQIVRDALRYFPHLESSPDFEDRVLDAIRDAPAQHVWLQRTPTRRERTRLWFAQRVLRLEKLFSIAPKLWFYLCAAACVTVLFFVLHFALGRASHIDVINSPAQMQAGASTIGR